MARAQRCAKSAEVSVASRLARPIGIGNPWLAVDAATSPALRARELRSAWERFVSGDPVRAVRAPVVDSWRRSVGVDPSSDHVAPAAVDRGEASDRWEAHPLRESAGVIRHCLQGIADEADHLIVVSDASGVLLELEGSVSVRSRAADSMNFTEGALWSEGGAGTNAVGTAVAADHAVQIFAAEHFNKIVHGWTCSAAPVHDPDTGELLGVIDLTGLQNTVHAHSLAAVMTTARAVEGHLRSLREQRRLARDELTASRANVVAAQDEARKRIQRDLHDGAQQRLVCAVMALKMAHQALGDATGPVAELVGEALAHAELANSELRELAHGTVPAALSQGGLRAGIGALVSRMPLPVALRVTERRLPAAVEAAAYFIVAESLTNAVRHARAASAQVAVVVQHGSLCLEVRDDGVGGADGGGSGLLGLRDRAAALNGRLLVNSAPGAGTCVAAKIPIPPAQDA
jgi:signal transduction histidine kinase